MTAAVEAGPVLLTGTRRRWDCRRIAVLREERGWSQEELAERSGVSVRTIRNLELGWVQNPRRSSVDRLADALGVEGEQDHRAAGAAEQVRWRGPQPPPSAMVGSYRDHERLMKTVRANRLTTFFGPGGVGKTRLALSIAAEIGHLFRHGVVVVELGDLPPERHLRGRQSAAVLQRVRRQLGGDPALGGIALGGMATIGEEEANLLLVLDNAEHIPDSVTAVTRELLSTCPGIQILTTARRRLTERLGVNREIRPLSAAGPPAHTLAHDPAVELVLRHAGADSWAAADDLARELPLVAELCRRLGRLPRYLEFAAERLRTIPVKLLLAHGPTKEMLSSNDHALLPHQRSLVGSLRWDMDLLTEDHRRLLGEIAAWSARRFTVDDIVSADGALTTAVTTPLALLSDLQETSLIVADTREKYRYRLAPYVAEVAAQPTLFGRIA